MDRRLFLRSGLIGGLGLVTTTALATPTLHGPKLFSGGIGNGMRGLDLQQTAALYRRLLFDEYLPFWERGGYDDKHGGFMCYLYDDGSVQDERKDIWYQGRGIWIYSYVYNNLDRNTKWLDMAMKSRDFMVQKMHNGDGTWKDTVDRVGNPVEGIDYSREGNIYGALFAAVGLLQLSKATGNDEDLQLAKKTLLKSIDRYEAVGYPGVTAPGVSSTGLRAQGHSFMIAWVVPQLLDLDPDPQFELLVRTHLDLIASSFWNPEYGISNEILFHDYQRIPSLADQMVPGHSIETQWMAMVAAERFGLSSEAEMFKLRMKRLIEMSWDYVFDGTGDTDFRVFASESRSAGPEFNIKTMWAQTEVLVGTLKVYSRDKEDWALDWYERCWDYVMQTMTTDYGVWRQAVDRRGTPVERPGISPYRKGNFHQPRCLAMNLVELEKMIGDGK